MMSGVRPWFMAILVCVTGLLGFGLYLQHFQGLDPCPLCILQRIVFIAIALTALLGAIHDPRAWGRKIYSGLVVLFALTGAGVAGWQVYLQHLPPDQVPGCGPGLDYMLDVMTLDEMLPMVFGGSGECAEVAWRFLGISITEWALAWFLLFALAGVLAARRR